MEHKPELCSTCKHLKPLGDGITCDINAPRWDALLVPIYANDSMGGCTEYLQSEKQGG